mmetsp:Transcript_73177/g.214680  ORF Transcript_73177/g.214680 Transcript_73177/m.214680 type:complete len:210 (+) Transcript_73177:1393-2022(+)
MPRSAPSRVGALWSLSRSLYRRVFTLWSADCMPGEMHAIMTVRDGHRETNASRSTRVSLEARNGTWASLGSPIARMHSFKARRDLLICAPSTRLWRMLDLESAARSEPARSTKVIFARISFSAEPPSSAAALVAACDAGDRMKTAQTACEREESRLMAVAWVVRSELPSSMHWSMAAASPTVRSVRPAIWTSPRASSSVSRRLRLLSRS